MGLDQPGMGSSWSAYRPAPLLAAVVYLAALLPFMAVETLVVTGWLVLSESLIFRFIASSGRGNSAAGFLRTQAWRSAAVGIAAAMLLLWLGGLSVGPWFESRLPVLTSGALHWGWPLSDSMCEVAPRWSALSWRD